jgi:hypothetical protein
MKQTIRLAANNPVDPLVGMTSDSIIRESLSRATTTVNVWPSPTTLPGKQKSK